MLRDHKRQVVDRLLDTRQLPLEPAHRERDHKKHRGEQRNGNILELHLWKPRSYSVDARRTKSRQEINELGLDLGSTLVGCGCFAGQSQGKSDHAFGEQGGGWLGQCHVDSLIRSRHPDE